MSTRRFLSRAEAAAALGISKSTFVAALRAGKLLEPDAVIGEVEGWSRASVERMAEMRARSAKVQAWAAKKGE
ncbi:XRE family transcriptional regulator [Pseudoclavibacter sp. CFCC 13611]|nr:XRE family transcriptional regulator [Pseudoclavibacter sp. CFCC 13611]